MIQKSDKRRHPRVKIAPDAPQVQIYLFTESGSADSRLVRAVDLSRMGMSFAEASAVAVGTRCTILINHRRQPLRIIGKVVHSRPGETTGHVISVRFTSICPVSSEGLNTPLTDDPTVERLLVDITGP